MGEKAKEEKKKIFDSNKGIIALISITIILVLICIIELNFDLISEFSKNNFRSGLNIENIVIEDNQIKVSLEKPFFQKERWCQALKENEEIKENNWLKIDENICYIDIDSDIKYIVIKDNKITKEKIPISNYLNTIISLNTESKKIILVEGEEKDLKLEVEIEAIGSPNTTLNYTSENEELFKFENNKLIGISKGETNLIIQDKYNHEITIPVIVTDLITTPRLDEKKTFLKAGQYTEEEAHLLDEILEERVNEAGLKTRAGVVAAARFITLEFKYKIPYFLENGRYQKTGFSEAIDGEGRFYHKGLYLSKDKFEIIKRSKRKPAMWGETLYEYSNSRYMKNGLDCSGFVTWALYNGGFEPGDIGAGPNEWYTTLPDLGKSQNITLDLLKSGQVKAGDLIGWNGHIGLIIGIDENNIYTADTIYYSKGLVATKYTLEEMAYKSYFTHIYDMSEYYAEDGNYTNMW